MVDTKPLLKGLGAAADVVSQIATDKAVNSRRLRPGSLDLSGAQLVERVLKGGAQTVPHRLGRLPSAAWTARAEPGVLAVVVGWTSQHLDVECWFIENVDTDLWGLRQETRESTTEPVVFVVT